MNIFIKGKKDDSGNKDSNDPSWSPQITNIWSKSKANTKLTARKSTGGKAPNKDGKVLKCEKCDVILTTQVERVKKSGDKLR